MNYWHESLACAFEYADLEQVWNAIPRDKQEMLADSLEGSADMKGEMESYSRPSASDTMASRERELKAQHARELADLDDRRQREERDAQYTIGRLQNRIYEMQREMERAR